MFTRVQTPEISQTTSTSWRRAPIARSTEPAPSQVGPTLEAAAFSAPQWPRFESIPLYPRGGPTRAEPRWVPRARGECEIPEIQRKAIVSEPSDPLEREADAVADRVSPSAGPAVVRPAPAGIVQRACAACEEDEKKSIHAKRAPGAEAAPSAGVGAALRAPRRSGAPLEGPVRSYFEPRFGFDLGSVRIHADDHAAEAARSVRARAYTVGRDIVFGRGEYTPNTRGGQWLLAHELTHVIQQGSAPTGLLQRAPAPDDPAPSQDEPEELKAGDDDDVDDGVEDGDTDVIGVNEAPGYEPGDVHGPEPGPMDEPAEPLRGQPSGKIHSIDVDLSSQKMMLHFPNETSTHTVSTGRGRCGTSGDPCPTQKERNCTPPGEFITRGQGNASTKNSHGDKMAWFVGLDVPGRKGIGIHNSQYANGTPRSHGCVRTGDGDKGEALAKLINQRVVYGKTRVTIKGRAKTKPYPCRKKKP